MYMHAAVIVNTIIIGNLDQPSSISVRYYSPSTIIYLLQESSLSNVLLSESNLPNAFVYKRASVPGKLGFA